MRTLRFTKQHPAAILVIIFLCGACSKLPKPAFSYEPLENPEAGESVRFINESGNALSYNWEFGDGNYSDETNPVHRFENAGIYSVKLMAMNDAGEESVSEPVTIFEPTVLQFTVYDSTGEQVIEEAQIELFDSEEDLKDHKHLVISALTDVEGKVRFMNMEAEVYYVLARKETEGGLWRFESVTPALKLNSENLFYFSCMWISDDNK